jgi:hypothetical protein
MSPISARLPPRVEQRLAEYCATHKISKSDAVKRALEGLFEASGPAPDVYKASSRFRGSDPTPGDVARHSKELLRRHFRGRSSSG